MNPIMKKYTQGLTKKILIAMAIGFVLGLLLHSMKETEWVQTWVTGGVLKVGSSLFIASLQVLVVPLVFVSLVCGSAGMEDIAKLGRIGGKTVLLYLLTTAVAITAALLFSHLIQPGVGFELTSQASFTAKEVPSFVDVLIGLFPKNPIQAMSEGNMLQIIVFSILFGFTLSISGEKGKKVLSAFETINEIIMNMIMVILVFAPYGVFCLISKVFIEQGFDGILPLAKYFFLVVGVLLFHALLVYPLLLKFLSGLSPLQFFRNFKSVLTLAFSTSSSNATLPVTLEVAEEKLGVHPNIASFTIPLGATINMDGTAIMQGVATGFIAQAYGIELGFSGYLMVIVTATLASIGTAGVPGVGLIMLTMVLQQVNLPVEGIGLVLGVDRLLDMTRTAVNVTGDGVVSCIVAKTEKQLDEKVFYES